MKILKILLVSLLLVGCSTKEVVKEDNGETITLNIVIVNKVEDTELFNQEVTVAKVETLEEFLNEQNAFAVETSTGAYGGQIDGMMDLTQDFNKGPWWVYESSDNAQCVEAGYCDGISNLKVADGDSFTFEYTDSFE